MFHAFLHVHLDAAFAFADIESHFAQAVRHELAEHNRNRRKQE